MYARLPVPCLFNSTLLLERAWEHEKERERGRHKTKITNFFLKMYKALVSKARISKFIYMCIMLCCALFADISHLLHSAFSVLGGWPLWWPGLPLYVSPCPVLLISASLDPVHNFKMSFIKLFLITHLYPARTLTINVLISNITHMGKLYSLKWVLLLPIK